MCSDTADRCPVSAYFDRIDACLIKKSADGKTFRLFETAVGKVTAIDLDRDMKRRRSLPDAVHDIQKDTGTIFSRTAVHIGAMIDRGADEASQEKEMRRVDLYAVKSCLICTDTGTGVGVSMGG